MFIRRIIVVVRSGIGQVKLKIVVVSSVVKGKIYSPIFDKNKVYLRIFKLEVMYSCYFEKEVV